MHDYRLIRLGHSPNFYVEWREDGKPKRVSTGTPNQARAKEFLAAFRVRHDAQSLANATVSNILEWYYQEHAKELPSAEQAHYAIQALKRHFGSLDIMECTPLAQRSYVKKRRISRRDGKGGPASKPLSNDYINRELSVLNAAFRMAAELQAITVVPPPVKLLPKGKPKERWLARHEVAALYRRFRQSQRTRHLLIYSRLGIYSGPRPHEITGLPWERVRFDLRQIWYYDPQEIETEKRATVVHMDDKLFRMLMSEYRRQVAQAERLAIRYGRQYRHPENVIEARGGPVDRIDQAFKRHCEAIGITGVTPNTLRHTFATWAVQNGASLASLGPAMGHSNPKTTARYAKHTPQAHRDVIQTAGRKKRGV